MFFNNFQGENQGLTHRYQKYPTIGGGGGGGGGEREREREREREKPGTYTPDMKYPIIASLIFPGTSINSLGRKPGTHPPDIKIPYNN